MKNVVILESLGIPDEALAALQAPLRDRAAFTAFPRSTDVPALIAEAKDADALILANMPLPGAVIEACPRLQFIDVAFTGVDHVDLAAAKRRGIRVSNASGYSDEAVAELVIGMALSLLRNVPQVQERLRSGGTRDGLVGSELRGKTVGILGYGRIGRRSGELFRAFGCRILAHSRRVHDDYPDFVEQVSFEELLERSDLLVLHCPLSDSTRGLIDYRALCRMKPSAYLINAARGPVTVEVDLARALKEGVIAGAAVDVFDTEPPLRPDHPLLDAPNTLLTPHVAFATQESMLLRAQIVFDNLRAWLDGGQINTIL